MMLFVSCFDVFPDYLDPNDYEYRGGNEKIYEKTSLISTFEHLNDPIVFAMPVYEKRYYKGKKKKFKGTTRYFQRGDIFVVVDIDTNRIFDWVYFGEETMFTNSQVLELGENPKKYYTNSVTSSKIVCLSPESKTVSFVDYKISGASMPLLQSTSSKAGYATLLTECGLAGEEGTDGLFFYIFDSKEDVLNDRVFLAKTRSGSPFNEYAISDEKGNFWLAKPYNKKNYLWKLDRENNEVSKYELNSGREAEKSLFTVNYVEGNKIYISKWYYEGNDYNNSHNAILLYEVTGDSVTLVKENKDAPFFMMAVNANDQLYAVKKNSDVKGEALIDVFQINKETLEMTRIPQNEDNRFRCNLMYGHLYVRGTKLYLVNSWDKTMIGYKWYDVETGEYNNTSYIIYDENVYKGAKQLLEYNN